MLCPLTRKWANRGWTNYIFQNNHSKNNVENIEMNQWSDFVCLRSSTRNCAYTFLLVISKDCSVTVLQRVTVPPIRHDKKTGEMNTYETASSISSQANWGWDTKIKESVRLCGIHMAFVLSDNYSKSVFMLTWKASFSPQWLEVGVLSQPVWKQIEHSDLWLGTIELLRNQPWDLS